MKRHKFSQNQKPAVASALAAVMDLNRKGKMMLSVKGVTQTAINPPTFTFQVNNTKLVHFSFKRFLENKLRASFGFAGTPLRLEFKAGSES